MDLFNENRKKIIEIFNYFIEEMCLKRKIQNIKNFQLNETNQKNF